jgi:hypothetical protein
MRELERRASIVTDAPESTDDVPLDSAPPTPLMGTSGTELVEGPAPGDTAVAETPKTEDVVATPMSVVADEAQEEVVESSQPTEEAKAAKGLVIVECGAFVLIDYGL